MTDRCRHCDGFIFRPGSHKCPPRWLVWDPDLGETSADARPTYATDAEEAAEKYQEHSEASACEYTCMEGGEVALHVLPADELASVEQVQVFHVTGEAVPSYRAAALKREAERTPYRVSTIRHEGERWAVKLEDLAGEDAGGVALTEDQAPPPAPGVYVHAAGEIGEPGLVLSWRDRGQSREVTITEGHGVRRESL